MEIINLLKPNFAKKKNKNPLEFIEENFVSMLNEIASMQE